MSLVAYASSEDSASDSETAPESRSEPPPRTPPGQAEAAAYPGPYSRQGEQEYYGPPGGVYGLPYPPGYGPPPNYGPSSYGAPAYPASPGPPGYGAYNSQGPGANNYPNMGYNPTGYINLPPPQGASGMNLPPPQGASGMNLPPMQGASGMNLPPPQGASGMNLPPPQGATGMNLPPPQGASGMNLPPPQGASGMNLPPPQGATGMNLPPPQGASGMNLPPPQGASGMNLPPPQGASGMNLPPPQGASGMNLPPPQGASGMNLPPPQGASGMNLPPHSGSGMNLPPPPPLHGTAGMNLPPPQSSPGLHLPPPQNTHGINLPPPQGGHGLNLPPPQSGHGMNLPPPMGGHAMNLPPPQVGGAGGGLNLPPAMNIPPPKPSGPGLNLPPPENEASKPKKRSEPVRISVPELRGGDSDSEEDEPFRKKATSQVPKDGFGLSSLLPQPRNASGGDGKRQLLPYSFTKKASEAPGEPKPPKALTKPKLSAAPEVSHTPSPSAIKAAAKNAALQVTKQITQEEDEDSDDDFQHGNFFSLGDNNNEAAMAPPEGYTYPAAPAPDEGPPGVDPAQLQDDAANAPLEFKTATGSNQPWSAGEYSSQDYNSYQTYNNPHPAAYYQDYYSSGYYQEPEPSSAPQRDAAASDSFMDDEAFKRLQGKRNRGREEINFVEIKGDDQLSGNQQWLTKALTEEKNMKSFSKKKGDQPTGQQRRKHQITYLIHQAKERELDLKNTWSENKMSRRQTQAKYGF